MSHSKSLRVLHIEDSLEDSQLIERCLQALNYSISLTRLKDKKQLKQALRRQSWDLVLSDFSTAAGLTAEESISLIRNTDPDLPFILVSRGVGEDVVVDLMKAGIEDVVLKNRLERLSSVVRRALREHDMRSKEARANRSAFEAFAAKERMLEIVSHDIKNPLSAVQLEAQSLLKSASEQEGSALASDVTIQAGRILKITEHMKTLISDLLDNNKGENRLTKLSRTLVDPANLFYEVVDSIRSLIREKQISLESHLPASEVYIDMDRNKMFQVFCNLMTNALKFTPQGGTIRFELSENESAYTFSFSDSGTGLPHSNLKKVFEKYWTGLNKEGTGTGLGLYICKSIVEAHGGKIVAENVKEGGARFKFTVPKSMEAVKTMQEGHEEQSHHEGDSRIFVIDDDDDLREVISWALSREGYQVKCFKDPVQALNILKNTRRVPGLILVDQYMEGMKGGEFLSLKHQLPNPEAQQCPTMIMSGSPEDVEGDVPHELFQEILEKPLDLEGLVGKVKLYFKNGTREPGSQSYIN